MDKSKINFTYDPIKSQYVYDDPKLEKKKQKLLYDPEISLGSTVVTSLNDFTTELPKI